MLAKCSNKRGGRTAIGRWVMSKTALGVAEPRGAGCRSRHGTTGSQA